MRVRRLDALSPTLAAGARPALLVVLLAGALSACAPIPGMRPIAPAIPAGSGRSDPFHALLAHSRLVGSLQLSRPVAFAALLRDRDPQRHAANLVALYNPHSKSFGRYDTVRQWETRFGPSPLAVDSARILLARAGVHVSWQRGNDWMLVRGSAATVERVFRVKIQAYVSRSGQHFYAAARDPVVPATLTTIVAGTGHISSYADRRARVVPVGGLRPSDLLTAYDMAPLRRRNFDGSGETIAFIEIDGFSQSDLDAFTQHFGLPSMHPVIAAGGPLSNVDGEADLDLEVAHEIAPGARLAVYDCPGGCSDSDLLSLESRAVRENPRGIISISIGGCEQAEGSAAANAENSAFSEADALGVSVFAASGDSGAFTCLDQDWNAPPDSGAVGVSAPASSPSVTAVGGTRLSLHSDSTWYREEVWENPPETAGSGGGISAYFSRPGWQRGPGIRNAFDTGNYREVPDVAADADPIGSAQIVIDGRLTEAGGTSQATPIWAGMTALIDQYLRRRGKPVAGFLNPALYTLARTHPSYPPFHDVTVGTNLVYPATPGYDLATGLGSPDGWNLARDLYAYQRGVR